MFRSPATRLNLTCRWPTPQKISESFRAAESAERLARERFYILTALNACTPWKTATPMRISLHRRCQAPRFLVIRSNSLPRTVADVNGYI